MEKWVMKVITELEFHLVLLAVFGPQLVRGGRHAGVYAGRDPGDGDSVAPEDRNRFHNSPDRVDFCLGVHFDVSPRLQSDHQLHRQSSRVSGLLF